jgi:hypothetical protein
MKFMKMLGISMIAAVAAMAIIGAGTASATLCKVNQSPCQAANQYPTHTTIRGFAKVAILTGSLEVTCEGHVVILHEGVKGGKLFGKITLLEWLNCKGCSPVTTTALPTFEDEALGGGNGLATVFGTKVELKGCLGFVTCKAEAEKADLKLNGGTIGGTATAVAKEVPVKLSGGLCGTTGSWTATYTFTEVNGSKTGSIFIV